jgi:hypothetical protein
MLEYGCGCIKIFSITIFSYDSVFGSSFSLFCYSQHKSRPALGTTQPPIQWVPGAFSLGVKRPGREADHSSASSAERSRNAWSYISTPQYVFMAWCLVKHRDNFTFYFTLFSVYIYFRLILKNCR